MDSYIKLIHSVVLEDLLHGNESRVLDDSANTGQKKVLTEKTPPAKVSTHAEGYRNLQFTEDDRARNRYNSRVWSYVEHQFRVIKRQFGFNKVR